MTPPEAMLWQLLRRSPASVRFRRQYAIGPYVADFYCPAAKLVIEIDGQVHGIDHQARHDTRRDELIRSFGVQVLRVPASEVMRDAYSVAQSIIEACTGPLHHSPTASGPPPHRFAAGRSE